MASDEIVWKIINNQFCSFKLKLPGNASKDQKSTKSTFCRNEHNVTGLCNRQSCPLANSRYATIRSDPATGRLYLYIKTIERAHMPNKWWGHVVVDIRRQVSSPLISPSLYSGISARS